MKKNLLFCAITALLIACNTKAIEGNETKPSEESALETVNGNIHINSIGFIPNQPKFATITQHSDYFTLKNSATGEIVFKSEAKGPIFQKDVDQNVWIADFSSFSEKGEYFLETSNNNKSINFKIDDNIYSEPFKTSIRAFYLWRCGTDVYGEYDGDLFSFSACHLNDGYEDYLGREGTIRDGTGGWHDAGDFGKYVVNAGISMGILLSAWDHFGERIDKIDLEIPESEIELPDFLKELKWEMDWLLKMQYPDGSGRVSHKLTRTNFSAFIMPDEDNEKRYFTEWSSVATAAFAATASQAARVFAPYSAEYSEKCLQAARLSYQFLKDNPVEKPFEQGDFNTGGYQTGDISYKIWASAEMWNTTGEDIFLKDFERQIEELNFTVDENWDWGDATNLGVFTYLMSPRVGKNEQIVHNLKQNLIKAADNILLTSQSDVYGRPFKLYYWGCNGTVARLTMNLHIANLLTSNDKYKDAAYNIIAHLFGRNYYNRSFVTGIGINPPMHPHDRRSGADDVAAPWPGYLVGGGHSATDWVDEEASYSHNEIAINWQASLVFALASMLE